MLLKFKGPVKVTNWENYDPDDDDDEPEFYANDYEECKKDTNMVKPHDILHKTTTNTRPERLVQWYAARYNLQREFVMKHFIQRYESGNVFWPRNFNGRQKTTMNVPAPIAARLVATANPTRNTLYVSRSKSFRKDSINNTYTRSIGHGLFTAKEILSNERVVSFNGEMISVQEYHLRTTRERGGYIISLSESFYLDCYNTRWDSQFLASIANVGILHCWDSSTNRPDRNHADIRVFHHADDRVWVASLFLSHGNQVCQSCTDKFYRNFTFFVRLLRNVP